MVAAGAIVTPGTRIPSGQIWAGSPAKVRRGWHGDVTCLGTFRQLVRRSSAAAAAAFPTQCAPRLTCGIPLAPSCPPPPLSPPRPGPTGLVGRRLAFPRRIRPIQEQRGAGQAGHDGTRSHAPAQGGRVYVPHLVLRGLRFLRGGGQRGAPGARGGRGPRVAPPGPLPHPPGLSLTHTHTSPWASPSPTSSSPWVSPSPTPFPLASPSPTPSPSPCPLPPPDLRPRRPAVAGGARGAPRAPAHSPTPPFP